MPRVRYLYLAPLLVSLFVNGALSPAVSYADSFTDTVTITALIESTSQNTPQTGGGSGAGTASTGGASAGAAGGVMLNTATTDSAIFKGLAYPGSVVSVLRNGVIVAETPASPNGAFEIKVQGIPTGTYTFGIRAEDSSGIFSALQVFTVFVSQGISVVVDGIFIPPTITTDKVETQQGSPIVISGASVPNAKVSISIQTALEIIRKTTADANGAWSYTFDTTGIEIGNHTVKARSITGNDLSLHSDTISFLVGAKNVPRNTSRGVTANNKRCDLNNDKRVNLLDFSIMAFWYKRLGFPDKVDLNSDKKVDLSDVSILAYCWTG
jgi:hypothetical protein